MARNIQFEERVCNLQHEDVRVTVVMYDQYTLHRPTHPKVFIVVLESLETGGDGWVLFWLGLLGARRTTSLARLKCW